MTLGCSPRVPASPASTPCFPGLSGHKALVQLLPKYLNPAPRNPSRTLSGEEALASLKERTHPDSRNFNVGTLMDRLDQGLPTGPQPPHSTPTSNQPWYGDSSQRANFGPNPTRRQVADSHGWLHDDGQSGECMHHFVSDRGVVGAASVQACAGHVAALNEGQSQVPRDDQEATRAHLVRHLRDGNWPVPQASVPPLSSGRAAQFQFEQRMTYGPRARALIQRKRGDV